VANVAGGLRFVHLLEMQTKARVAELGANLNAVIEVLVAEGHLPLEAFEKRRRLTVLRENERGEAEATVAIAAVADKYAVQGPAIDCAARVPLCKARCCTLPFVLSAQDLDEGAVRWDYARPYRVRAGKDGSCVHLGAAPERACSVHAQRPAACRAYDCRKDRRIWLDFDKWIPAP
jgi:Fe-S-cluster containining protein